MRNHTSSGADLREKQREKRRRAKEWEQQQIVEAGIANRRQESPLAEEDLNRLGNMASALQEAYVETRSNYEAIEAPDHHIAGQMVMAIEVSIRRLADWVAKQRNTVQGDVSHTYRQEPLAN